MKPKDDNLLHCEETCGGDKNSEKVYVIQTDISEFKFGKYIHFGWYNIDWTV